MKTVRATLESGQIRLEEPLPLCPGRRAALVVLDVDEQEATLGFPKEKLAPVPPTAEDEFEAIGLRDFFGDPVDEAIAWEDYFTRS